MQETQEMLVWSLDQEGPPGEEGMATHSRILSWRIPWTEEPGGLHTVHRVIQSIGPDWSDLACMHLLSSQKTKKTMREYIIYLPSTFKVDFWVEEVRWEKSYSLRITLSSPELRNQLRGEVWQTPKCQDVLGGSGGHPFLPQLWAHLFGVYH